jgi:hypothetical protein
MAQEDVVILKVNTEEAVQNIGDLKQNIKELKQRLDAIPVGTEDGWKDYQATLKELKVNQNALKDAMYATSGTMEDVAASAKGASNSYNSLVHKMAELKTEWRATNDEARRNELGKQIAEINQQLKDMDASVGNFSRNVGNYESGTAGLVAKFDEWGGVLKQLPPTLGATKEKIGKVGETMQLVGKQPILGIIGLLAPIIMKITEALKENDTAMGAVNRAMASLQPIFDVFSGIVEKVAEGVAFLVEKFLDLVGENGGVFSTAISKISGFGNAMLQFMLTPTKTIISAFVGLGNIIKDVFTGKFDKVKEDAQNAWEGIKGAWQEGFSFEQNFAEGKQIGADFLAGVADNREKAKQVGAETAAAFQEGYDEELERIKAENAEDEEAEAAHAEEEAFNEEMARQEEWEKQKNEALWQSLTERLQAKEDALQREADLEQAVADATTQYLKEQEEQRKAHAEATAAQRIAVMNASAQAVSGILNSLADAYESDEKNAEKNEKKIKALRIASATIDMLQGAVTAFASSMSLGPIAGPIVGAVNAASVVAMGVANINKIKSTNFNSESGGSVSASVPSNTTASVSQTMEEASAVVEAPNIDTGMQTMRSITSASEEDRLNRMASSQRVYILQSDIEASNKSSKTMIAESTF